MIAFLFAGQGAQKPGMGLDLYENDLKFKNIFDNYSEIRDLIFNSTQEELNQTKNSQKTIFLTSYAIASVLKERGVTPDYVCGLSLGEYSALAFSNTWKLDDVIEIVTKRGLIMQNATPEGLTGMCAVIGLDEETIKNTISKLEGVCEIANLNCPGQIVITGLKTSLNDATPLLLEAGASRVLPLSVSGAFHSSLLNEASHELRKVLDSYKYNTPIYKVLYNYTGDESNEELNSILEKQICHSVYFERMIRNMISKGVDTFVEIGPGKTLTSFVKKINKDVKVYTVNDVKSLEETVGGILS